MRGWSSWITPFLLLLDPKSQIIGRVQSPRTDFQARQLASDGKGMQRSGADRQKSCGFAGIDEEAVR
jgi:hypothetical protein